MLTSLSRPVKYTIIALEILIVVSVALLFYNFFLPLGKGRPYVYFHEQRTDAIIMTLKKSGYNITDWDHYLIDKRAHFTPGWYRLGETDKGRWHFLRTLWDSPLESIRVRIYAGETHHEIIRRLAQVLDLNRTQLLQYYKDRTHFQEAEIFARTYTLPSNADAQTVIDHLFENSAHQLKHFKRIHNIQNIDTYTLKLLLIIASIIQKESNDPAEMPFISSVIYNRIERGMKLQMDGTLNYGAYSHTIVTPERIRQDNSFYNTYKYRGLPPAPLGSITLDALNAALNPAKSDYLFFMLTPEGSHHFSKTYQEHLVALKAFREYQKKKREHPLRKGASGKE